MIHQSAVISSTIWVSTLNLIFLISLRPSNCISHAQYAISGSVNEGNGMSLKIILLMVSGSTANTDETSWDNIKSSVISAPTSLDLTAVPLVISEVPSSILII